MQKFIILEKDFSIPGGELGKNCPFTSLSVLGSLSNWDGGSNGDVINKVDSRCFKNLWGLFQLASLVKCWRVFLKLNF